MMFKASSNTGNWFMRDNMRGWTASETSSGPYGNALYANLNNAEAATSYAVPMNATGFTGSGLIPSYTYIYVAIRRGPMRVPTDATKVFSPQAATGTQTAGFPVDLDLGAFRSGGFDSQYSYDRLRGGTKYLITSTSAAEATGSGVGFDSNTGVILSWPANYVNWYMRRAPSFFDEVCYTGNATSRTLNHNLGVAPELMIVKDRTGSTWGWYVYASATYPNGGQLNRTDAFGGLATLFPSAATSTTFAIGSSTLLNTSGNNYVTYLFATCAGVSKVTNFTGNGSSQTINCGFTAGARFVMIKRTDSTGDWYVWDTARGIVAGNDPHLSLNTTAAEVTTNDTIDTDSTGFIVNQVAATNCNVNGASYIVLAIA
jgi:hypothetical protein